MAIRVLPSGKTSFYTDYDLSQRGQATEDTVELLLRDRYNLEASTEEENRRHDLDFRMDWKGQRIAVSLKDESSAPAYAAKKKMRVPDIYFETKRHNRVTRCWEPSAWFDGKGHVTHYMIAWWLEEGQLLELRIYAKSVIHDYLLRRYSSRESTFGSPKPQGWHKVFKLSPQKALTQVRLYDNAECGYIPSNAVHCDLLRFRYNGEGSLEEITYNE